MSKVTVFDSFVVDLMARNPHLPVPGETVKDFIFKMGPGGKGLNQCVTAHKARAEMVMVAKVGGDSFTNVTLDTMTGLGIDKEHIFASDDGETGIVLILVNENTSQNKIIIIPRTYSAITDEEIKSVESVTKESEHVLLQLEVNQDANEMAVDIANRYECKVIVNTAPYSPVTDNFLSKAYTATPNEVETEELAGIPVSDLQSTKEAAAYFYDKGVQKVLVTLNSRGVLVSSGGGEEIVPAFRVNAVDTTGAGDTFNRGLLAALTEGKDIWEAVRFANGLAALSVQKLGTTPSMSPQEEIDAFLRSTQ